MLVNGIQLALIELLLFFMMSDMIRVSHLPLLGIPKLTYYWLCFTVLTGIWEWFYISNRPKVKEMSRNLLLEKKTCLD